MRTAVGCACLPGPATKAFSKNGTEHNRKFEIEGLSTQEAEVEGTARFAAHLQKKKKAAPPLCPDLSGANTAASVSCFRGLPSAVTSQAGCWSWVTVPDQAVWSCRPTSSIEEVLLRFPRPIPRPSCAPRSSASHGAASSAPAASPPVHGIPPSGTTARHPLQPLVRPVRPHLLFPPATRTPTAS